MDIDHLLPHRDHNCDDMTECMEEDDEHSECNNADEMCWTCYEAVERSYLDYQEALATGN